MDAIDTELAPRTTTGQLRIHVLVDNVDHGDFDNYVAAEVRRLEVLAARAAAAAQGELVADGLRTMAAMGLPASWQAEAAAPAPVPAPKRRKAPACTCTCPLCTPDASADGVYRCRAGQEWVAYHAGSFVGADANFLQSTETLNNHRHTLLSRPLPDASPEDVADVLAASSIPA